MASFSLAAWLGYLVVQDASTGTAIATPLLPPDLPSSLSFPDQADATTAVDRSQPFEFSSVTPDSLSSQSTPASVEAERPVASAIAPGSSEPISSPALLSSAGPAVPQSEPENPESVAQQPITIPTFSDDPDICFANCNPSAQFNFRAPDRLTLTPPARPSLPTVVQVPAPATPSEPAPAAPASAPTPAVAPPPVTASELESPLPSTALTPPTLQFQGVYLYQGDEDSARARIIGVYPITPRLQVGGSIDITDGDVFSEGGDNGVRINELYLTAAPQDLPNLRLVVGQLDLTSYFDRNSFAKDAATQFFNPVFSTNPALAAAGIGSRQGALVNWTITDNVEARGAIFSSDRSISEFELNAFAGEIGVRFDNLIVRGTYVTAEDSGDGDGFQEIFNLDRGNGQFGAREGDRENAYGINAEYFIPEINVGIFGRYGYYENTDIEEDGDTFNFGVSVYDLITTGDRIGLGYGRALSNDSFRRDNGDRTPDVLEVFYDFRLLPGLRAGFTFQALEEFSESIAGFRVRTEFDLIPRQTP